MIILLLGISDYIITKLAACISVSKLDTIYDKKDKLKTKLFQRKIEFLFDVEKYRYQFENSSILKKWRNESSLSRINKPSFATDESQSLDEAAKLNGDEEIEPTQPTQSDEPKNPDEIEFCNINYTNYLYECENDASTLFKCKLCSKLMTKKQSANLKCQLAILNAQGNYMYLHVPDEVFDMTNFIQLLKDKLKQWQSVYWFLWALIKHFKCKKCNDWFRLAELNKCRLNQQSFCCVHDMKISSSFCSSNSPLNGSANTESNKCTCIYINHVLESGSISQMYSKSPILSDQFASSMSPEQRMANYLDFILENLEKHSNIILHGHTAATNAASGEVNDSVFFCDSVEELLQFEKSKSPSLLSNMSKENSAAMSPTTNLSSNMQQNQRVSNSKQAVTGTLTASLTAAANEVYETSFFIDSITGKHISLLSKHILNLIKITQLANASVNEPVQSPNYSNAINSVNAYNISSINNMNLDLKTCLMLINQTDVRNMFNSLDMLYFSKVNNRIKWDANKMTRLNQDNQREDDLNKFRELSSYLIKTKLVDEYQKPTIQKSNIANLIIQQQNIINSTNINSLTPSVSSSIGGIYCRVENEWKYKWNKI